MKSQRASRTIGELAQRYGVSAQSLRVWERQGLIPRADRTPGGHRRYNRSHRLALDELLYRATPLAAATQRQEPTQECVCR